MYLHSIQQQERLVPVWVPLFFCFCFGVGRSRYR